MGDIFLIVFNCACILVCTGFAVGYAVTRVRQESITLWLTVMYIVKYIDREKEGIFSEFVKGVENEEDN